MNSKGTEFIVYGGSFNPPTDSHRAVLGAILHLTRFDNRVVFIEPAAEHAYGKPLLPLATRMEMANIAFADFQSRGACVTSFSSTLVHDNPKSTYSFLKALKSLMGQHAQIGLVVGGDQFNDILNNKWINSEDLLRDFKLYVIPRGEHTWESMRDRVVWRGLVNTVKILDNLYERYQTISSTQARDFFKNNDVESAKKIVPYGISEYCVEHNLYR
jgi:nicotinate (nicotinamide) nucleotide adenylyltransferase